MRIARIIEYFPPHIGGMERHGFILTFEQIRLGHEVEVFIGHGGEWKYNFKGIPSDFSIKKAPLQFLPLYNKIRRLWFNIWAIWQVIMRHFIKKRYNIIHLHGDFVEAFFGGWLSKILGIPAVLTIHAGLNKRLLKPKNAKYFKNIKKIICVSQEINDDLQSIGIPEDKLTVISSGINLIEFNNAESNTVEYKKEISDLREKYLNQDLKTILISVGFFRVSKGFKYLFEAYELLKKEYSLSTLLVIGNWSEEIDLKHKVENLPHIRFLGDLGGGYINKHEDVIKHLKAADIFISSSINLPQDREGTPTSIMEAMAAGLPIIATKVGDTPQLIVDGINGFLVNPRDPDGITKAVIKLIESPDLARKMGEKNKEDIKQKDWTIIAKKITDVYNLPI